MTAPFQLGSISTGTLKTEDLLPVVALTLLRFSYGPKPIKPEILTWAGQITRGEYPAYPLDALRKLQGTLNDLCPPFVYFGPHPDTPCTECKGVCGDRAGIRRTCNGSGDGADFGFWPDWDGLDEALVDSADTYIDGVLWNKPRDEAVLIRCTPNVTVMDLDRNVLWTTA